MISYPELTEFAKLCFVDDLDNSMICTQNKSFIVIYLFLLRVLYSFNKF